MSSINELSSEIKAKESEKTLVLEEKRVWMQMQATGIVGRLSLTITEFFYKSRSQVVDSSSAIVSFGLMGMDEQGVRTQFEGKGEKKILEAVEFDLRSKEMTVSVSVLVTDANNEAAQHTFVAEYDIKDVSEDTSSTCELEGKSTSELSSEVLCMRIKASFDRCETMVKSKETERLQIDAILSELLVEIQAVNSAGGSSSSTKKKASKKKSGDGSNSASSSSSSSKTVQSKPQPWISYPDILQKCQMGVALAFHYRAYWMFAGAAATIALLGDYASI